MAATPVRTVRAFALAALVGLAGCGVQGSGFRYLSDRQAGAFVKVPEDWGVFQGEEVLDHLAGGAATEDVADRVEWTVTFDAHPKPSIGRFFELDAASRHPSGLAEVIRLTPAQRDQFSLQMLRNVLVDVDQGAEEGKVEDLTVRNVSQDGGRLQGQRAIFTVVKEDGTRYTIDQTGLFDDGRGAIYVLAVGCEATCFEEKRRLLDQVVTSWKIKRR